LISTVGDETTKITPDKYWGISNVGFGAYMWQVTNIKDGWIWNVGKTTQIDCTTKTATGSGKQATIAVTLKPEQLKECMTATKMIPTTATISGGKLESDEKR